MKLTVEEVAKLTKLSVATVRLHAANKKLGTKEGNRRYFSGKDVEAIKASSSSGSANKKAAKAEKKTAKKPGRKPAAKKAAVKKSPARSQAKRPAGKPVLESKPKLAVKQESQPQPEKRSFWSFLRPRPKQKVSLLDAQVKK